MTRSRGLRLATIALLAPLAGAAADVDAARLGERLYRHGINARGEPLRALAGVPPAPLVGGPAACSNCHGADARGDASPLAAAPAVRWSAITAGSDGRKPYDERLFARAVSEGIASSGAPIGPSMPRYSLSRGELAALVAFLKSLPAD